MLNLVVLLVALIGSFNTQSCDNFDVDVQTFEYPNFANLDNLQLNGKAAVYNTRPSDDENPTLILTQSRRNEAGSAFHKTLIPLGQEGTGQEVSFSTFFQFKMSQPDGINDGDGKGADGILFIVQVKSAQLGASGGGMGFKGVKNTFGVELDSWRNSGWDGNDRNHIGVDYNGNMQSYEKTHVTPRFNDGNNWYCWVDYDGKNKKLEVRLSFEDENRPAEPIITHTKSIVDVIDSHQAYVGFSAATGGAYNLHEIIQWKFSNSFLPFGFQCGVGRFFNTDSLDCEDCPAGTRQPKNENVFCCQECPDGYYSPEPKSSECLSCGCYQGTCDKTTGTSDSEPCNCFTGWTGDSCDSCDDGFYGPLCTECPDCGNHGSCDEGEVGDVGGTGQCVCDEGWKSISSGECSTCDDGFYSDGVDCVECNANCLTCDGNADSCTSCANGFELSINTCVSSEVCFALNGLFASYYSTTSTSGNPRLMVTDPNVDMNWYYGSPFFQMIPMNSFSTVWTGYLTPKVTADYTFDFVGDKLTLTIDGTSVLINSVSQTSISLVAGTAYPIYAVYTEEFSGAQAVLRWTSDSTAHEVVPVEVLSLSPCDYCPFDGAKIQSGTCGCHVSEQEYIGYHPDCSSTEECCSPYSGYFGGSLTYTTGTSDLDVTFNPVVFVDDSVNAKVQFNKGVTCISEEFLSESLTDSCLSESTTLVLSDDSLTFGDSWTSISSPNAASGAYHYSTTADDFVTYDLSSLGFTDGEYYISVYSNQASGSFVAGTAEYAVNHVGGSTFFEFTNLGNGWRLLGKFNLDSSSSVDLRATFNADGSKIVAADDLQVTSYNPECDQIAISLLGTSGSNSEQSFFYYIPDQQTVVFEARAFPKANAASGISGWSNGKPNVDTSAIGCDVDLSVGGLFDTSSGHGRVSFTSTGSNYQLSVSLSESTAEGCEVYISKSVVYNLTETLNSEYPQCQLNEFAIFTIPSEWDSSVIADRTLSFDQTKLFISDSTSGLLGKYYEGESTSPTVTRVDSSIDFIWTSLNDVSVSLSSDSFTVEWKGYLLPSETNWYNFKVDTSGTVSLNVYGEEVSSDSEDFYLEADAAYAIELTVSYSTPSSVSLQWRTGSNSFVTVSSDYLSTYSKARQVKKSATGFLASYFQGQSLSAIQSNIFVSLGHIELVDSVDNDWGTGSPSSVNSDLFYIEYKGIIKAPSSDEYTFFVRADDFVRLHFEDYLILDQWTETNVYYGFEDSVVPVGLTTTGNKWTGIQSSVYEGQWAVVSDSIDVGETSLMSTDPVKAVKISFAYRTTSSNANLRFKEGDTTITTFSGNNGWRTYEYIVSTPDVDTVFHWEFYTTSSNSGMQAFVDAIIITPQYYESYKVTLIEGQSYPIRLEYYENTDSAQVQLNWKAVSSDSLELVTGVWNSLGSSEFLNSENLYCGNEFFGVFSLGNEISYLNSNSKIGNDVTLSSVDGFYLDYANANCDITFKDSLSLISPSNDLEISFASSIDSASVLFTGSQSKTITFYDSSDQTLGSQTTSQDFVAFTSYSPNVKKIVVSNVAGSFSVESVSIATHSNVCKDLVTLSGSVSSSYPCAANPVTDSYWVASFEGQNRASGDKGASYRLESVIVADERSPIIPFVPVLYLTEGTNSLNFDIYGDELSQISSVSIGSVDDFSAQYFHPFLLLTVIDSISTTGVPSLKNLKITGLSSLSLGDHSVVFKATHTSGQVSSFDRILRVISASSKRSNTAPSFGSTKTTETLYTGCEVTLTVQATDSDTDDVYIDHSPWVFANTKFDNSASLGQASKEFTFTPSISDVSPTLIQFLARDSSVSGFTYHTMTLNILEDRPCDCNGHGTCGCNFECQCDDRYDEEADCSVYTNSPPTLSTTILSVDEDSSISNSQLSSSDVDNDAFIFSLTQNPSFGVASVTSDGVFSYTPIANFNGEDTVKITLTEIDSDEIKTSETTLTITVNPINDAPVVTNNFFEAVEDDCTGSGFVSATDIDGDPLTYVQGATTSPDFDIVLTSNGAFHFTCSPYASNTTTIFIDISDGTETVNASVTLAVSLTDNHPEVNDDFVSAEEDIPILFDVLANDNGPQDEDYKDSDNDQLYIAQLSIDSADGTVEIVQDDDGIEKIKFTSCADCFGEYTFTYKTDDKVSPKRYSLSVGTVTITVKPINDAPLVSNYAFSMNEDTVKTESVSVLGTTDIDSDSSSFVYSVVNPPTNGVASFVSSNYVYSPSDHFCGSDSFTFKVYDGFNDSSVAIVSITVNCDNDAPIFDDLGAFTMDENTLTTNNKLIITLTFQDPDSDDSHTISCTSPSKGSLTIDANIDYPANNNQLTFSYIPTNYLNGDESFDCVVTDSADETDTITVQINVNGPDNHIPVLNNPDVTVHGLEDTDGNGQLSATDYDVDDSVTYEIITSPDSTLCSISLNEISGIFSYSLVENQNGICSFTWNVKDESNASAESNGQYVIVVAPDNDNPVASDGSVTTNEDVKLSGIQLVATDVDLAIEGDILQFSIIQTPTKGTLVWDDQSAGVLTYQPYANENGQDTLTFRVIDSSQQSSSAELTITINAVNDAPIVEAIPTQYIQEDPDSPLSLEIKAIDVDHTFDQLTFTVNKAPIFGSSSIVISDGKAFVTYDPNTNFNGHDSLNFAVSDGVASPIVRSFDIVVNPVNDAPIANDDTWIIESNVAFTNTLNFNDAETAKADLSIIILSEPAEGTLTEISHGSYEFDPPVSQSTDYTATFTFTFKVDDGSLESNVATITLSIIATTSARPTASDYSISMLEDGNLYSSLESQINDADGDDLIVEINSYPAHGTLVFFDEAQIQFLYEPNANFNGGDSFTFVAKDTYYTSSQAVYTITVNAQNDKPVIQDVEYDTEEDVIIWGEFSGFDVEQDTLTFRFTETDVDQAATGQTPTYQYPKGTIKIISPTQWRFIPAPNAHGTQEMFYTANDGTESSDTKKFTVTISSVNDAPVSTALSFTVNEDSILTGNLFGTDVDGDSLTYSLAPNSQPEGSIAVSGDGSFTFTPTANFFGTTSFNYRSNDGFLFSKEATVTIIVLNVNDAPVASNVFATTSEDIKDFEITLIGSDIDGDAIVFSLNSLSSTQLATLKLADASAGTVKYTPRNNFYGQDTFRFKVSDTHYHSSYQTVTVTVTPVNDPPVIKPLPVSVVAGSTVSITVSASDIDSEILDLDISEASPTQGTVSESPSYLTFAYTGTIAGTDVILVKVNDEENTVEAIIYVYVLETAIEIPVAQDLYLYGNEGSILNGVMTSDDSSVTIVDYSLGSLDNEYGTLTVTENPIPAGAFQLQLSNHYYPSFTFMYTIVSEDGGISEPATVYVNVYEVNDEPVAYTRYYIFDEDSFVEITLEGYDEETAQESLQYFIHSQVNLINDISGQPTLDANVFSFQLAQNFNGELDFEFKVSDGSISSTPATIYISVKPIDDPPTATSMAIEPNEDEEYIDFLEGNDVDGDPFSFVLVTLPKKGILSLDSTTGEFMYISNQDINGQDSFTFLTKLNTMESQVATVSIDIQPINDPPVCDAMQLSVLEDSGDNLFTFIAVDVEDSFSELIFQQRSKPQHGVVIVNSDDGTFTYKPEANYYGPDSFDFLVRDTDNDKSEEATISITVVSVPDAPATQVAVWFVDEDSSLNASMIATDDDGDELTYILKSKPFHGTIVFTNPNDDVKSESASPEVLYTPEANYNGADLFSWSAKDDDSESSLTNIVIKVRPVNDDPIAEDMTFFLSAGDSVIQTPFDVSDVDVGDTHTFFLIGEPTHEATASVQGPNFVYQAGSRTENYTDTLQYYALDSDNAQTEIKTITIEVAFDPSTISGVDELNNDNSTNFVVAGTVSGVVALLAALAAVLAYLYYKKQLAKKKLLDEQRDMFDQYENPLYGGEPGGPSSPAQNEAFGDAVIETFNNPLLN